MPVNLSGFKTALEAAIKIAKDHTEIRTKTLSESGFYCIKFGTAINDFSTDNTNLTDGNTYKFNIEIDGAAAQTISIIAKGMQPPLVSFNDVLAAISNSGLNCKFYYTEDPLDSTKTIIKFISKNTGSSSSILVSKYNNGAIDDLFSQISKTPTFMDSEPPEDKILYISNGIDNEISEEVKIIESEELSDHIAQEVSDFITNTNNSGDTSVIETYTNGNGDHGGSLTAAYTGASYTVYDYLSIPIGTVTIPSQNSKVNGHVL